MAQRVRVILVCDLHGDETPGDETVVLGLDGVGYEIDLCAAHASRLRDEMASYVAAGRRVGGRPGRRNSRRGGGGGPDRQRSAEIRAWARNQGIAVSERGRIPASLAERYDAAH
ncbi:MAG TPA: Lsr2 family protein [Mycobacteriales bacterium]|nr:Lsr2 family protein [Mycobacteriales bacterium]